jgi:hypothetical protein
LRQRRREEPLGVARQAFDPDDAVRRVEAREPPFELRRLFQDGENPS